MKKLLLSLLACLLAAVAAAQPRVELGARAGVTSQDLELRILDFNGDNFATDASTGFHAAVVSRVRLIALGRGALGFGLFFQPEVVYTQNNYKMQKNGHDEAVSKIRMQSVDVPLMLSLKVSLVRVQAGPVFNLMYRNSSLRGDITMTPTRPMIGYAAGLSVDIIGGLVLDGRYYGQFKELKNHIKQGETVYGSVRGSLSSWSVGLSWLF